MRWLATSVLLVAALVQASREAAAKPARRDMIEPFDYAEPCERAKTWKRVTACNAKQGVVTTLYDTDAMKVIGVSPRGSETTRLHLYVPMNAGWGRASMYAVTNKMTELLSIAPYATTVGTGVRIDLGVTWRSNISIDAMTSTRGLLRRVNSVVCVPSTWACRNVMIACEAYVRGKVFWTFRGELVWDTALGVRLRGDMRNAGGACQPPRAFLDEDE